jgi:hypothetical protein
VAGPDSAEEENPEDAPGGSEDLLSGDRFPENWGRRSLPRAASAVLKGFGMGLKCRLRELRIRAKWF